MDDAGQPASPDAPHHAGDLLRAAREAHGLTLAEIASRTRIPIRHLEAIELGNYAALPAPTYAVGFARGYARAAGADEVAVAQAVRAEVDRLGPRTPEYVPYETADPARVPSRGVAIVGVGTALAVLILVGLFYGTSLLRGGGDGAAPVSRTIAAAPPAPSAATPAAPTGGQVRLAAKNDVWLRVYDADNKTLYLGTMKPGETFDVPADAKDPMINVGRPDQLIVTLNGTAVPPLGSGERAIKDVRVSGSAIAARIAGQPQSQPSATPSPAPSAAVTERSSGTSTRSTASTTRRSREGTSDGSPSPAPSASSTPAAPRLTDTQRANIEAARDTAPVGNDSQR